MAASANLKKIGQNVSEKKRLDSIGKNDAARAEIQEIIGNDIVDHERLIAVVLQVFNNLPRFRQATYTADEWRADILVKCQGSLDKAAQHLRETNEDPRVVQAKIRTLNVAFIKQVNQAMRDAAERQKAAAKK